MAAFGDYSGSGLYSGTDNTTTAFVLAPEANFDLGYEAVTSALFWLLFVAQGGFGLLQWITGTWRALQRWPLFFMLLVYLTLTCVCESCGLAYSVAATRGRTPTRVYLVYVFFWHASSASFLVLLLALSSGYCITRGDLSGQMAKVMLIPLVVFVAGVASDFTFVYVADNQPLSAAADRYRLVEMSGWEEAVWFLGSLANIMCFVLAWVYVFDSTQLEIKALDDAQEALHAKPAEEEDLSRTRGGQGRHDSDDDSDDDTRTGPRGRSQRLGPAVDSSPDGSSPASSRPSGKRGGARGDGSRGLGTISQRQGLLYGMESSAMGAQGQRRRQSRLTRSGSGGPTTLDLEQGQGQGQGGEEEGQETVADHLEYSVRKRLLSRFYWGVCSYLLASISVVLLPAFFNGVVQNTLVVLQFVVKYAFTALLAVIFRPARDSPYLQVGLSDTDADTRGVSDLDTELTVTDVRNTPAPSTPPPSSHVPSASHAPNSNGRVSTTAGHQAAANASNGHFVVGGLPASQLPVSTPAGSGEASAGAVQKKGAYKAVPKADAEAATGHGVEGAHSSSRPRFTLGDED